MTALEFKKIILRRLNVTGSAPGYVHDDVIWAINSAFQDLWTVPPKAQRAHYTQQTIEVELLSTVKSYALPASIQGLVGPVRFVANDGGETKTLHPVASLYEILNFEDLMWTGDAARAETTRGGTVKNQNTMSRPVAYFLDSGYQAANEGMACTLWVAPTPTLTGTLKLEVETEAPRFEREDFCEDEAGSTVLPLPNRYIETMLVPVASFHASRSHWFKDKDLLQMLETDYMRALGKAPATAPETSATRKSASPAAV